MAWQYWTTAPRQGVWREVPTPQADAARPIRVRTTATAISKGTETLVHTGHVPATVAHLMRAPHQLGEFSYPVSYGYLAVGVVDQGPTGWLGQRVFGLLPHHTHHVVAPEDVLVIPPNISDHRALLTGAAETGINILWQHPPRYADRVAIIGAGMIGAATALLASQLPLERLEVVEVQPQRRALLEEWGLLAVAPPEAAGDCDVVIHVSGSQAGLIKALELAGDDATVVEASWYGDHTPQVPLGADFHARRLQLVASQVGQVAQGHRHRRTVEQRRRAGLQAVADERFAGLITGVSPWGELPKIMDLVATPGQFSDDTVCHVVEYPNTIEGVLHV